MSNRDTFWSAYTKTQARVQELGEMVCKSAGAAFVYLTIGTQGEGEILVFEVKAEQDAYKLSSYMKDSAWSAKVKTRTIEHDSDLGWVLTVTT